MRSRTAMVITVKMPTLPTKREMPPSAPTAAVSMPSTESSTSSICSWVVMVKSSWPWRASKVRRMAAAISFASAPSR